MLEIGQTWYRRSDGTETVIDWLCGGLVNHVHVNEHGVDKICRTARVFEFLQDYINVDDREIPNE